MPRNEAQAERLEARTALIQRFVTSAFAGATRCLS
jgi:hypothetical protein